MTILADAIPTGRSTATRTLVIHAPNVHQGGGLALLQGILEAATRFIDCEVVVDSRFRAPAADMPGINLRRVAPRWFSRLNAEWRLRYLVGPGQIVLCFGNLPPLFRLRGSVFLLLQNRYLTSSVTLTGFSPLKKLQIMAERLWLRWRISNADTIVVQSPSMQREIQSSLGRESIVIPFAEQPTQFMRKQVLPASKRSPRWDFVYVASGEPHKNHIRLVLAWKILAAQNLTPSLCLTVSRETFPDLVAWIDEQKYRHDLHIDNAAPCSREEVTLLYRQARALIFPSLLESLGLPLIEARCAGLSIVASELDYVRDVVDPEETFNAESEVSMARAVMRFLGSEEVLPEIVSSRAFLERLLVS